MGEEAESDMSVSVELRRLTLELQDAVCSHDRARLESLVAEDFALAGSSRLGALNRQGWIEAAMEVQWRPFELIEFEVTAYSDIAIVMHRLQQTATLGGEDISSTWLTVDTWWRSGRSWQIAGRCARRRTDAS